MCYNVVGPNELTIVCYHNGELGKAPPSRVRRLPPRRTSCVEEKVVVPPDIGIGWAVLAVLPAPAACVERVLAVETRRLERAVPAEVAEQEVAELSARLMVAAHQPEVSRARAARLLAGPETLGPARSRALHLVRSHEIGRAARGVPRRRGEHGGERKQHLANRHRRGFSNLPNKDGKGQ